MINLLTYSLINKINKKNYQIKYLLLNLKNYSI